MEIKILSLLLILFTVISPSFEAFCPGDNWIRHDDRCIKLFQSLSTFLEASATCPTEFLPSDVESPRLLEVRSAIDQTFITNLFLNNSNAVSIWLGGVRSAQNPIEFIWTSDTTPLNYSNWAPDSPSQNGDRSCIEMYSDLTKSDPKVGDWRDVTCDKGNWFACQKLAPLSVPEMTLAITHLTRWRNNFELHYDHNLDDVYKKFSDMEEKQSIFEEKQRLMDLKISGMESSLASLLASHNTLQSAHNSLKSNHDALHASHDALQMSHNTLQNNHDALYSNHTELQASHNSLQSAHDTLNTKHNTLQTAHNTLKSGHDALQTSHNSLQTAHNNLKSNHDSLQLNHNTLQTAHNTLKSGHDSLNTKHNTLQTAHNTLKSNHDALQTSHNILQTAHNTLKSNHDSLQSNHNTLQTAHNTLKSGHDSLNTKHNSLQTSHNSLNTNVANLPGKVIPIGFIFVQLPWQSDPRTLWPHHTWSEVSSTYAGRFFRVVGGSAAPFELNGGQSDAFQSHQHGGAYTSAQTRGAEGRNDITVWFNFVKSNTNSVTGRADSETRPINHSVRVWKRLS